MYVHTRPTQAQPQMWPPNLSIENLSEKTHVSELSMDERNHNCFH